MDPFQADDQVRPSGYLDGPMHAFLQSLADPSPEPAGGCALATAAAMAAALVSLVAGADLARASGSADRALLSRRRAEAAELGAKAQGLIDGDASAYAAVVQALALPAATEDQRFQRRIALDASLARATDVPLTVAETALEVLHITADWNLEDHSPLRGDLAAARALGEGAARGSLATAWVNIVAVRDPDMARRLEERAHSAERRLKAIASLVRTADVPDDAPGTAAAPSARTGPDLDPAE